MSTVHFNLSSTYVSPTATRTCNTPDLETQCLKNAKYADTDVGNPPPTAAGTPEEDKHRVILDLHEEPKSMSTFRKWVIVTVISVAAFFAGFSSPVASFTEVDLAEDLHTSHEVTILSLSLYIEGIGVGPLFVGPLSEIYGRNIVYRVSYFLYWVFTWPVVFPPNMATFLVFRFITGFCSSAFLSVSSGSLSDLYDNNQVANPMAMFTTGSFLGPIAAPFISGFICQNTDWRWVYRLLLIVETTLLILIVLLVPETYQPVLVKWKAERLRKQTGDDQYWAPIERREQSLLQAIVFSCCTPFKLIFNDRMALLLDTWDALILGILYLTFQAFPIIFEDGHGFNKQETGMSFLGMGFGLLAALATQPFWNRYNERMEREYNGKPPAETRLVMGQVGAVLAPLGLYCLAFTTFKGVPWIVPIIVSAPFGAAVYYIFTSTFTYMVIAYRPIAASAMASNSAMRFSFAAAFPLFAGAMYDRLGTVGATALLAGLATVMMPLPFVFYKIGARLRAKSPYAVDS